MESIAIDSDALLINLSKEYVKSEQFNTKSRALSIDRDLRTVRIFISSTFRDFHNERNLLVTKVFPRLRDWCSKHGLYLVECDLRWGIPTYVSREETLITCFEEIERGRNECNNMNFFLGLLGDRYGWIPGKEEITEYIKRRYGWIEDSSVTLMEFIHGIIRTQTPNGLIMIRSSDFINQLPENRRSDFIEKDPTNIKRLNLFKQFLIKRYSNQGRVQFYEPVFEGTIYDKFIEQDRVSLVGLESFCETVENYFKVCIKHNLLKVIDPNCEHKNNDNFHALMVRGCGKHCTIRSKSCLQLFEYISDMNADVTDSTNPIVVLSGVAGIGKSTILAYCVKMLRKQSKFGVFFHSMSCTSSSQYTEEIIERLFTFLNGKMLDQTDLEEKIRSLSQIFINGVGNPEHEIYYVVFDGLDELCSDNNLAWLPNSTNKNIVIVISTLLDSDPSSFYSKLRKSERKIEEIQIEPMTVEELSYVVSDYLDNFGKRLEQEQMDDLLSFKNSNNPLWLLSACEELRIHGDFSTISKFILSLPPDIHDLNKLIIKRLISQDSTNVLRCFLRLLIVSRAGIWENIVRPLISSIMNYDEPISNTVWLDIVRQLKGFLLLESIPMPLIRFRHRVIKHSIENEMQLDKDAKCFLHGQIAKYFKPSVDGGNTLFLPDYFYHLIKSNARNQMIEFMRSKQSWSLFKRPYTRSNITMSMRCTNHLVPMNLQHSTNHMVMCVICSNQYGKLSIYSTNKNCCFYCGNVVHDATSVDRLSTCVFHRQGSASMNKCVLCETAVLPTRAEYVKVCQSCKNMATPGRCGAIVKEHDTLYRHQVNLSENLNLEHWI